MTIRQKLLVAAVVMLTVFFVGFFWNDLITKPQTQIKENTKYDLNTKKRILLTKIPDLDLVYDGDDYFFYYPSELTVLKEGAPHFSSNKAEEVVTFTGFKEYQTDVINQDIDFKTWNTRFAYEITFSRQCSDSPKNFEEIFDKIPDGKAVQMQKPVGKTYLYDGSDENGRWTKLVSVMNQNCLLSFFLQGGVSSYDKYSKIQEKIFNGVVDSLRLKKKSKDTLKLQEIIKDETQRFKEISLGNEDVSFKFYESPSGKYLVFLVNSWNQKVKYDNLVIRTEPQKRLTFDHPPFCVADFDSAAFTTDESSLSFIGSIGKSQPVCDEKKRIFLDLETGQMREK